LIYYAANPFIAQPIVRDLSKVCQNFLALEEENRQLVAQLDDVRREYLFFSCSGLLQKAILLQFLATSFKWSGIGAQPAADKTSLKTQLDDLAAENSGLKAKADELANEIARLKAESSEAQERAKKSRLDAESREKDLHQRLQTSLDALRGESAISLDWVSSCRLIVSHN
jgi:cell division protein FtsB